jgi:3-dehydroquinate dehydratase/shikimate dehydrogenase
MRTKICAVVFESDADRARDALTGIGARADLCELRLDALAEPDRHLENLLALPRPPVIVTNRPVRDGGRFRGGEQDRIRILLRALELGAEHVDVEVDAFPALPMDAPRERLIASHHDFEETPTDRELDALLARLEGTGAAIVKLVTTARSFEDNLRVLDLPARASRPVIALCMGEAGRVSRLLAARFGGYVTYGATGPGSESAPGQYPVDALLEEFGVDRIGPRTSIYGILGGGIGYSLSPRVHNRVFRELGLDRAYLAFDLSDPEPVLADPGRLGIAGLSVTIPHKEAAARHAAVLDEAAREIGAVNTLVRDGGRWSGSNTDGPAVAGILERRLANGDAAEARILVLGAGGAARAVAWAARSLGLEGWCASRSEDAGRSLAERFGLEWIPWSERHDAPATIVCNATPIGTGAPSGATAASAETSTPFHASRSRHAALLFDTVYIPRWTPFLAEGSRSGCAVVHGIEMFLAQAALQCRLFTGEDRRDWFLERFADLGREGDEGPGGSREPGDPAGRDRRR